MLREAKNGAWTTAGPWFRRRVVFTAGRLVAARGLRAAEHAALEVEQRDAAVEVLHAPGGRTYWWCMDRFFWEDDGLSAGDVFALVYERNHRAQRRLARAHQTVALPDHPAQVAGEAFELQFDHIIPVALGGASTAENLQILCGPCNRAKGAEVQ
jgi:hypothetical protein